MGVTGENLNTDSLLSELGGCGNFQVILAVILNITFLPSLFSFFIETFGMYNPGWKCLDNTTMTSSLSAGSSSSSLSSTTSSSSSSSSSSLTTIATTIASFSTTSNYSTNITHGGSYDDNRWTEYGHYSCPAYESCKNVEFSPDASTIVTEWGLTCDNGWIISTMLSVRMAGYLCSTMLVGYIGDRFGRKFPFILSRFLLVALNLVSFFSVSWEMYTVASFAMGFIGSYGLLAGVTMTEYVSPSWRIKIQSIPSWSIMSIMFALIAMYVSDWRILRLVTTISGAVLYIPIVLWMPESLRWMSIKGKKENLKALIAKIAKLNKKPVPKDEVIESLVEKNKKENDKSSYTVLHLFKKGYRTPTIIIGFLFFSTDVIYFAFHFGIAALPGNFFTNLMMFSASDLPANFIAFAFANRFRRKPSMILMYGLSTIGILGIVALDQAGSGDMKVYGIMGLVMVTKLLVFVGWIVMTTAMLELYPTVVRSTVNGYAFFFSSLGGIFSPYLVPSDPSAFYICYIAMAILTLLCACSIVFFPETKGKALKDTWTNDGNEHDDDVWDNGDNIHVIDAGKKKQEKEKKNQLV